MKDWVISRMYQNVPWQWESGQKYAMTRMRWVISISRMPQNMPRQDAGGQKCVMTMAVGQEGMVSGIDCCIKGSNNSPCDLKETDFLIL